MSSPLKARQEKFPEAAIREAGYGAIWPEELEQSTSWPFEPVFSVLHITKWRSPAMAFPSPSLYSGNVGIDIGIESELIQPQRRFFLSPLTAFR